MPFDGIVTKAITEELQEQLINGKLNKIHQPTNTELVLTIRNNRQNHVLLLSIHPMYARRSEEHTSELQSRGHLVCRLLLEKKNTNKKKATARPNHTSQHT